MKRLWRRFVKRDPAEPAVERAEPPPAQLQVVANEEDFVVQICEDGKHGAFSAIEICGGDLFCGTDRGGCVWSVDLATMATRQLMRTATPAGQAIAFMRSNTANRRITTIDANGTIVVWMPWRGHWYEEMINNRGTSRVVDVQWTHDGREIVLFYADGTLILGSLAGVRLFGSAYGGRLIGGKACTWSPTNDILAVCTESNVWVIRRDLPGVLCEVEGVPGDAPLHSIALSAAGLVCVNEQGTVHILSLEAAGTETYRVAPLVSFQTSPPTTVAWAALNTAVAVGTAQGSIHCVSVHEFPPPPEASLLLNSEQVHADETLWLPEPLPIGSLAWPPHRLQVNGEPDHCIVASTASAAWIVPLSSRSKLTKSAAMGSAVPAM